MKKEYFILWNVDKSEGFITDNAADIKSARTGKPHRELGYSSQSSLGAEFYELYGEEGGLPRTQKINL